MKKVLIFDLDRTLFNPDLFVSKFVKEVSDSLGKDPSETEEKIKSAGREVISRDRYLNVSSLIEKLSHVLTVPGKNLEEILFDPNLFKPCFYDDVDEVLTALSQKYTLVLFSRGDAKFQGIKAQFLNKYFKKGAVYIFTDKISNLNSVIDKYKTEEIVIIDDSEDVLEQAKKIRNDIYTILIKRGEDSEANTDFIDKKIYNLRQILEIL